MSAPGDRFRFQLQGLKISKQTLYWTAAGVVGTYCFGGHTIWEQISRHGGLAPLGAGPISQKLRAPTSPPEGKSGGTENVWIIEHPQRSEQSVLGGTTNHHERGVAFLKDRVLDAAKSELTLALVEQPESWDAARDLVVACTAIHDRDVVDRLPVDKANVRDWLRALEHLEALAAKRSDKDDVSTTASKTIPILQQILRGERR